MGCRQSIELSTRKFDSLVWRSAWRASNEDGLADGDLPRVTLSASKSMVARSAAVHAAQIDAASP
jgi:hypothetical protein